MIFFGVPSRKSRWGRNFLLRSISNNCPEQISIPFLPKDCSEKNIFCVLSRKIAWEYYLVSFPLQKLSGKSFIFRFFPKNRSKEILFLVFSQENCPEKCFFSFSFDKLPWKNFVLRFLSKNRSGKIFFLVFSTKIFSIFFFPIVFPRKTALNFFSLFVQKKFYFPFSRKKISREEFSSRFLPKYCPEIFFLVLSQKFAEEEFFSLFYFDKLLRKKMFFSVSLGKAPTKNFCWNFSVRFVH